MNINMDVNVNPNTNITKNMDMNVDMNMNMNANKNLNMDILERKKFDIGLSDIGSVRYQNRLNYRYHIYADIG